MRTELGSFAIARGASRKVLFIHFRFWGTFARTPACCCRPRRSASRRARATDRPDTRAAAGQRTLRSHLTIVLKSYTGAKPPGAAEGRLGPCVLASTLLHVTPSRQRSCARHLHALLVSMLAACARLSRYVDCQSECKSMVLIMYSSPAAGCRLGRALHGQSRSHSPARAKPQPQSCTLEEPEPR